MKRTLTALLALAILLCLAGCGADTAAGGAPTQEPVAETTAEPTVEPEPTAEPTAEPAPTEEPAAPAAPTVMVLNGTTGFGMAKLMADAADGAAGLDYAFSVESDASAVSAALVNGTCDIAALPTNAAAAVYNKTQGGVQLLALNTRGVLYLVVNSQSGPVVESLADLEGMTVYAPAQNPTFIFKAICQAAGVDVTVDDTYAQPADLRTALAAGEVDMAVLPEPMVTIAMAANADLTVALDLTAEWDKVYPAGSLVQGCVVARTAFVEENPQAVDTFLAEYAGSVALLDADPDAAAALIEQTGVFAQAAVARKAIPNCNVCFLTGGEMKTAMSGYLSVLYDLAPESVGGALPGDDFYYGA